MQEKFSCKIYSYTLSPLVLICLLLFGNHTKANAGIKFQTRPDRSIGEQGNGASEQKGGAFGKVETLLKETLDSGVFSSYVPDNFGEGDLEEVIKNFYNENDYQAVWVSHQGKTTAADELLLFLQHVDEEGLKPEHYQVNKIQRLYQQLGQSDAYEQPEAAVNLELLVTSAYIVLASDLHSGRLNPAKFDESWKSRPGHLDFYQTIMDAFKAREIKNSLENLRPKIPQYEKLKEVLTHYKSLAKNQQLPKIQVDSIIQKGDSGQIVRLVRERLEIFGDLKVAHRTEKSRAQFDDVMELAVKTFQKRHGITADGVLGPDTYGKLNISLEDRVNQIVLNLERLRWMPRDLGEEYILVNVPEFKLRIYNRQEIVDEMRVIVGKEYNATPIFSETLEYIAFSPTWTVPISILRDDFYDKLVKDPSYLNKNHFEIYADWNENSVPISAETIQWRKLDRNTINYKLVQKPGPWNALGRVKFMMPNKMAIYLHDTPTTHLFNATDRSYSHGCIRVERPIDLAVYLLKDGAAWNHTRVSEYLDLDEPKNVVLPKKVPVHIVYKTAWVDDGSGDVYFLSDVYNHDKMQLASLEKAM